MNEFSSEMRKYSKAQGVIRGPVLMLVALCLCLSVLLINRGPLIYFDTGSYIRQGTVALNMLFPDADVANNSSISGKADSDDTASGSRSLIYGIVVAAVFRFWSLTALPLVHVAMVMIVSLLAAVAGKRFIDNHNADVRAMTSVPLIVAAFSSLPFYSSFLMPDIFAPILLIAIGVLVAFGQRMRTSLLLLTAIIALIAVVVHPSHLGIAALMVPVSAFCALFFNRGKRKWRAFALIALIVVAGAAERKAFQIAVETVTQKEVIYTPHLTARLIVDGPGMEYLNEHCPNEMIATCELHEALSLSDDPYRLTVSHIIYDRSRELGSFQHLSKDDQARVARDQRQFFFDVLLSEPVGMAAAFAKNTYRQIMRHSITMTIPDEITVENARRLARLEEGNLKRLSRGKLSNDRAWIETIDKLHAVIYGISTAAIFLFFFWPQTIPGSARLFAFIVLTGLIVNAFVCGGISQPADRYGARVIWLLPYTATFLAMVAWYRRGRRVEMQSD